MPIEEACICPERSPSKYRSSLPSSMGGIAKVKSEFPAVRVIAQA